MTIEAAAQDRELVFSRTFAAPVEAVYRAWTDPTQLIHWWGPRGFSMTINSMELKVGGVWDYVLHGPDGTDYPNRAVFEAVDPPARLVFFNTGGHPDDAHLTCRMTVTFEPRDSSTLIELVMRFESQRALERAKARGAETGGAESFDRFEMWLGHRLAHREFPPGR